MKTETSVWPCSYLLFGCAALGGHIPVVEWLLEENGNRWEVSFLYFVTRYRQNEMLRWALGAGCPLTEDATRGAATVGDIETLDWLVGRGVVLTNNTFYDAIANGPLSVVKHLVEVHHFPLDHNPFGVCVVRACRNEGSEVLKWLIENQCTNYTFLNLIILGEYNPDKAIFAAVKYGNLEAVQCLRELGCPFGKVLFIRALFEGFIDIMEYLMHVRV